jgi:hypothetical protein
VKIAERWKRPKIDAAGSGIALVQMANANLNPRTSAASARDLTAWLRGIS